MVHNGRMAGRSSSGARRTALFALLLAAGLAASVGADAQSSILHELIPPDPAEDVSLAATTLDGELPAAVQTPSGVVTAPDPQRAPDSEHVYGGATTDDSPDARYEPDRDTRRPDVETYDDPFSPATAPFKRLRAYDAVDPDYTLRVRDRALHPLTVGGSIGPGDELFYGDLSVDLLPDEPVRIPTVGPGARVLKMHVTPAIPVELVHDAADNWFARSPARARVRLVLELAIPRATFGSELADVDWLELDRLVRPQPPAHHAAFEEVAKAIGISRAMRPRDVVTKMVAYYRAFVPSDEPPRGRDDIYLDLALSQKGVCRHRAFAFLVTALEMGIPARMVVNEAHAWVEVYDGSLWHRIDLGGAAANLEQAADDGRPPYVPPPDPYPWPANQTSGDDLARRTRDDAASRAPGTSGSASPDATSGAASASAPAPSASAPAPADPERPPADIAVTPLATEVVRGLPLHVHAHVATSSGPCPHVRVDVTLVGASLPKGALVGSLSTDDRGDVDGAVVIPRDFAVGDYDVSLSTPGDARCGASVTR